MRTRRRNGLIALVEMFALICLGATTASAHPRFKSSEPPDNAMLTKAPAQILLTFTLPASPTKSGASVTDASGALVSTGFKVDPSDGTKMTIDLKPNLANGTYTVKWNTLAEDDGGTVDGTLTFMVQAPASTVAPAATNVVTTVSTTLPSMGNESDSLFSRVLLAVVIISGIVTIFAAGLAFGTRAQRA